MIYQNKNQTKQKQTSFRPRQSQRYPNQCSQFKYNQQPTESKAKENA
jgi:hypothetical protein